MFLGANSREFLCLLRLSLWFFFFREREQLGETGKKKEKVITFSFCMDTIFFLNMALMPTCNVKTVKRANL